MGEAAGGAAGEMPNTGLSTAGALVPARTIRSSERLARWGLGLAVGYITLMVVASGVAARDVQRTLVASGFEPVQVMVAPEAANPFRNSVIATSATSYQRGDYRWLERPRVQLEGDATPIPVRSPVTEAAAATLEARRFLTWSRFPVFQVEDLEDGYQVRIRDLRFSGGRDGGSLGGLMVRLDRELRVVGE
jgi:hypothetical protein